VGRTILIADDSPTVQKKASGILTGEGMEVVTVSNGVAAIKKLSTVKPMVILADVSMPGKDGYEVCEFVKGSVEFPNVPVVLVFSDDDIYDEQKGARARADGRIRKPFDPSELINTVTRFLAISEAAHTPVGATMIYKIPPRVKPAPPPPPVVEPMDEEPDYGMKKAEPDLSAFEGGVAFGETPLEELGAPHAEVAPSFESSVPLETPPAFESAMEPPPEPSPAFESASPFEAPPIAAAEFPPPPPDEPTMAPETAPSFGSVPEPAPEAAVPEPVAPPREEAPSEPVFIEEQAAPPPPPPPSPPAPEFGRTMMFRISDIAQPILSDEIAPEPAVAEPLAVAESPAAEMPTEAITEAPAEGQGEVPAEAEGPPVSAASLESYSLSEAAAGHVRFAATEEEASPSTMAEEQVAAVTPMEEIAPPVIAAEEGAIPAAEIPVSAPAQTEAAAPEMPSPALAEPVVAAPPATSFIGPDQIYAIVHMVVAKMSPRMGPQAIAEMAKSLADEINAELNASSLQSP